MRFGGSSSMHRCRTWFAWGDLKASQTCPRKLSANTTRSAVSAASRAACNTLQPCFDSAVGQALRTTRSISSRFAAASEPRNWATDSSASLADHLRRPAASLLLLGEAHEESCEEAADFCGSSVNWGGKKSPASCTLGSPAPLVWPMPCGEGAMDCATASKLLDFGDGQAGKLGCMTAATGSGLTTSPKGTSGRCWTTAAPATTPTGCTHDTFHAGHCCAVGAVSAGCESCGCQIAPDAKSAAEKLWN
mmetsp:Transcript_6655/g.15803  ORF Transcript_6655/g.15803 Transcript_6655/m.15803 type:complete len:248 (-) Transcript_6655:508-1251(-)